MLNHSVLAFLDNMAGLVALGGVLFAVIIFIFVTLLSKQYKRCPSNRVLVIYGRMRSGSAAGPRAAKTVHGGADFVWPLIQDYAYLSLEPIQIEIPLRDALSIENIRVSVPSIFTVAIGTSTELMQNAAIRLLGLTPIQIKQQAQDIIFGQLRQVIASMRIEDINRDRDQFLKAIQHSLEPELSKIGLVLLNVNITDITDESGYIQAIGQKAASQAVQQARGDVAEQVKLGEIRVAEAEREKLIQVASATKVKEIGVREAQREQAVRIAQLEKETSIGQETAKFEQEMQVKQAERDMRVSVSDANAKAIAGEAKAQAEVAATQAQLAVKQAEAYQISETRKREAEAAVQEAQNRAMAKAALAQAERIEAERRAELEAPAKAQKATIIVEAEAEAEKRKIEAEAQAAAIYAKLAAEAKGQYEILAKKGEGLREIINACGGAQQAFQMMMLEHMDHLALTAAQAISNIKFDKVIVWENGGNGNGTTATGNFLQSMSRTLPPMLQVMKDIGGIEVPEYLAKLVPDSGTPGAGTATAKADAKPAADQPPVELGLKGAAVADVQAPKKS